MPTPRSEPYTLIRARRRTLSLQLDREGNAVVRAPYGVKKEFIDRFVAGHADWLKRAREKQASCTSSRTSAITTTPPLFTRSSSATCRTGERACSC